MKLTKEQKYKIVKPIFDSIFESAVYKKEPYSTVRWAGFYIKEHGVEYMIVGEPIYDIADPNWYFAGQFFKIIEQLTPITLSEVPALLKRYLVEEKKVKVRGNIL